MSSSPIYKNQNFKRKSQENIPSRSQNRCLIIKKRTSRLKLRGYKRKSFLFLYTSIILFFISNLPSKILSAPLFDTSGATTVFSSLSDYTSQRSKSYSLKEASTNNLNSISIGGDKQVDKLYINPLGAISVFKPTIEGSLSGFLSSNVSENLIIGGLLKDASSNTIPTNTFLVTAKKESNPNNLLSIEDAIFPAIEPQTLYLAYIFTFILDSTTKFQITIALNTDQSKTFIILNLNTISSGVFSDAFTGIVSYLTAFDTNNETKEMVCEHKFSSSNTDIKVIDASEYIDCVSRFDTSSFCPVKANSAFNIYSGVYKTTSVPDLTSSLYGNFIYHHTCDRSNNYALNDGSLIDEIHCIYDSDQYTSGWQQASAQCQQILCSTPVAPANAIVDTVATNTDLSVYNTISHKIVYVCPDNSVWSGPDTTSQQVAVEIECRTATNTNPMAYNTTSSQCAVQQCQVPIVPLNAVVVTSPNENEHFYGRSINYKCPDSYRFAPDMDQNRLSTVCVSDGNGGLAYQLLATSGCELLQTSEGIVEEDPTQDIETNIAATFTINTPCSQTDETGLMTTFSNNFAGLVQPLQSDASSNFQDYKVDAVSCDENSLYEVTVTFIEIRDANEDIDYNEKADLANTYLSAFKDYVATNNLEEELATQTGGTKSQFTVIEVSVQGSNDSGPATVISGAVIEVKDNLQNVVAISAPVVDQSTGQTVITFTEAISQTATVIEEQFNAIVDATLSNQGSEASVEEKKAELDIVNNIMETITNVFDDWTSTTKELNSTREALTEATNVATIVVALTAKNVDSTSISDGVNLKADVANNFLQSLNDMCSFLVQSDPGMTSTFRPFGDEETSDIIDIKINIIDSEGEVVEDSFGNNSNRKKRSVLNQEDRYFRNVFEQVLSTEIQQKNGNLQENTSIGTIDSKLIISIPPETLSKIEADGKCGDEPFYKQRDNNTVPQTNYLKASSSSNNLSSRLASLRSILGSIGRNKRDTTQLTGSAPVADRVTASHVYTNRCYFTIPKDPLTILEGPFLGVGIIFIRISTNYRIIASDFINPSSCISTRICGQRKINNLAEPISFKFSGKYDNPRNLDEPKLKCAWWDELRSILYHERNVLAKKRDRLNFHTI